MTGSDQTARLPEEDVVRMRAELASLHAQLDTRARRHRRVMTLRKVVAAVLVVVAAFGATASVVGVWSERTTLNTDQWVETVAPLQEDPEVLAAVSTYLTSEIYASLDVPTRVEEALPPRATFLATPLSSQVRTLLQTSVDRILASDAFAALWPQLNRVTHEQIVAIIEGDSAVIDTTGETAVLNLLPVVNEALRLLEQQVPSLFGRTLDLPTITDGEVPAGLQTRVEQALGVQLPDDYAQITLVRGDELVAAQDAVDAFQRYLLLLVLGSVAALGLALAISPTRRRTILQLGIWLVIAVVTLSALLRRVRDELIAGAPDGVYEDGALAATRVVFSSLRERGDQLMWIGVLLALVAYLVGPGRGAVAVRRWTGRGARSAAALARRGSAVAHADGPGFAQANLDALRLAGVAVAGVAALLIGSWTGLLVIAIVLGAYELLVTLAAQAAPEPETGPEAAPAAGTEAAPPEAESPHGVPGPRTERPVADAPGSVRTGERTP